MGSFEILSEIQLMRRHPLDMMIFFVTGQCNSRCNHCFYWKRTGPDHRGLPLERIVKISRSMPPFRTLLLSGGEPTLRSDLPQIVRAFRVNNHIRSVSVPTNGLLPERISDLAAQLAALDSELQVSFNVSLDGLPETHDQIRGQAGSYVAALRTLERLQQVSADRDNLRVYVNTVICSQNHAQILPLAREIRSTGLVDGHFFELVRGEPRDEQLKVIPPAALRDLYRDLVTLQKGYLVRQAWRSRRGLLGLWRRFTDVGNMVNRYRHQWRAYASGDKWSFPCQAGEAIGVLEYDGRLRICELRDTSVDLADYDDDFERAWRSPLLRDEAAVAKTHVCDCTHTCFLGISMRQDFKARFVSGPWLYLFYRMGKW